MRNDRPIAFDENEYAMTDQVFCYHCRRYHPTADVTLVQSKGVKRWRCLKSIAVTRADAAQRDAFGRQVSASNRANNAWPFARALPRPVLELLGSSSRHIEGLA